MDWDDRLDDGLDDLDTEDDPCADPVFNPCEGCDCLREYEEEDFWFEDEIEEDDLYEDDWDDWEQDEDGEDPFDSLVDFLFDHDNGGWI